VIRSRHKIRKTAEDKGSITVGHQKISAQMSNAHVPTAFRQPNAQFSYMMGKKSIAVAR
jgi:hypothetical protein